MSGKEEGMIEIVTEAKKEEDNTAMQERLHAYFTGVETLMEKSGEKGEAYT
ncbi:MAG: hypothetical protein IJP92_09680 [Lachnospiraceae bacterium]|nr:hypothetical protein [Lachnospiraceae bacterium]